MSGTSVIPPGWYPDPADDARLRRWDGQQWTQEVLLAPEQAPAAAFVPTAPPSAPAPYVAPTPAPPQPAAEVPLPPQGAPLAAPPTSVPQVSNQPPAGQPVPASPAPPAAPPSAAPPSGQPVPASPPPSAAPPGAPAPPVAPPGPPTVPHPSPPVNQHPSPLSGPVSLPEWSNLPGLTLPPDLSSLSGGDDNPVLHSPTFAEPPRSLPTLPPFEPPFIPQRPDVESAGRAHNSPTQQGPNTPSAATPYAPPPAGAQYDVPPPPGMAHVPTSGPVLPPSSLVASHPPATTWPQLPPVGSMPAAPPSFGSLPRTVPDRSFETPAGTATAWSWLIAALPLLQFVAVYVVFGVLAVEFMPGLQWAILAAPAVFSLLFASADRKKLIELGSSAPSVVLAFIPPLYLIVRCFTTGRSSVPPLIVWIVLQAGAAAGVYLLLPSVLTAATRAMGL